MSLPEQSTVLSSWKDIARYVGKGVRTVQRWELELGLPVRRPNGVMQKSAVVLHVSDLESWLETRFSPRVSTKTSVPASKESSGATHAALRESIRKARELRSANRLLAQQVRQSLRRLTEQCDALRVLSDQIPLGPLRLRGDARTVAENKFPGLGFLVSGPEFIS